MDEWLEDLDKCKDMGWYFEIESEESGRLADDIRKVLACIEQLEAALREIESISVSSGGEIHGVTAKHWRDAFEQCRDISRAALGEKKDD